ncbi:thiolase family protein [Rhodococcus pyridinivorans]|uniref:thiolase family protein n=1 Tax=Rhodococcus pyridinivorans TaxID=103816 RepID=UPI001E54C0A4|nr:thiolase family protein [Rhodococcus pyridinivorans]MCD5422468.1 thiolase family protein [Rhodococcus pyridinivorans]
MRDVYVIGAGMIPNGRYAPGSAAEMTKQAARAALDDAGIEFSHLDAYISASGHPLTPRGVYLAKELGVTGLAVIHVEHASATGLAAMHTAWMGVRSGQYEAVLVVGIDCPEREQSVLEVIEGEGNLPAPALFAMWANRRMHDRGTTVEHLAKVAAKNWNYARSNPFAARRSKDVVTPEKVLASRMVAPPLTSMMCTPWGEGAAAAVVCSPEFADRIGYSRPRVAMRASHLESETYGPGHVFQGSIVGPPAMSEAAARAVVEKSGIAPADVDVVQVHDAFAIEELFYYELLGFCDEGDAEALLDKGAFGPGSRERFGLPEFSTHGGLIAGGHPGGPTGLAQVHETVRQLRDNNRRIGMCHMLGAGSVALAQMYERVDGRS